MPGCLGGVDDGHDVGIRILRRTDKFYYRIRGPKHVRYGGEGEDLRT